MFNRVLTLFNKPKNNIRIIPKMSAEQEPPVKKQKPNYNFRQDEDYTRLEEKNPDLKKEKLP